MGQGQAADQRQQAKTDDRAGVVAPGFNVTVTMTLVAVAAGASFSRDHSPKLDFSSWKQRAPWIIALLASLATWPLSLPVLVAAGASWIDRWKRLASAGAVLAALTAALAVAGGDRASLDWLDTAALALLILPIGLLHYDLAVGDRRLLGLLLIVAGALIGGGDPEALAPGLLVLAVRLDDRGSVQLSSSVALAVGVALAAGFPWLHACLLYTSPSPRD